MSTNPFVKKLVQVSEESLPPVQVPLILGSDCYMVTQQDVRRIEDTRYLTFNKLNTDCGIKSIETGTNELLTEILKSVNANINCQQFHNQKIEIPPEYTNPQPMEVNNVNPFSASCNCNKANMEDLLKWDKECNTSVPFPFHYSCETSTTDLECFIKNVNCKKQENPNSNSCCCSKIVRNTIGTNTNDKASNTPKYLDAREQRKQNKLNSFSS